jgi:hypothetical protein
LDPDKVTSAPPNPVPLETPDVKELTIKLPTEFADEVAAWAEASGVTVDEEIERMILRALGRRR